MQFPKKKLIATGDSDDYDDSDDEEGSWVTKTTRYTKQVLYYLTDSEKFQPPRKKPKLVTTLSQIYGINVFNFFIILLVYVLENNLYYIYIFPVHICENWINLIY